MFDHNTPSLGNFSLVLQLGLANGHILDSCAQVEKTQAWHMEYNPTNTVGGMVAGIHESRSDGMAVSVAVLVCRKYLSDLYSPELILDFMRCAQYSANAAWMIRYCRPELPEEIDALLPPLPDNVREAFDVDPLWNTAPDDF